MHIALISFLANSINTRVLSACLKKHGFDVNCYFCPTALNAENLSLLVEMLRGKGTALVGVSLVTDDYDRAVGMTMELKRRLGVPVIWGGAHVNIKPEESLRHADMVCLGEGEDALLELVQQMSVTGKAEPTVRNIWFNTENGIVRNALRPLEENLDKLPFPDFDFDTQYIMDENGVAAMTDGKLNSEYSIMTSRGCPYDCQYCYNSYRRKQYDGLGRYLRTRSIENVIAELVEAKKRFKNLKEINFWDDSFVARRFEDFLNFKEQYKREIGLPFFALVEPMAFNTEKMQVLRESGLAKLQVGIQSGSERVNKEIYGRSVSNRKVLEVVRTINDMGIEVVYDLIFNNPYEQLEDIKQNIELLLQFPRPFELQGYNLIFYPGTEITDRALADGHILQKPEVEDFSTIQGQGDSPINLSGETKVSNRFYTTNYDSSHKAYFNSVVSLFAFQHVPTPVIRYFASGETSAKKLQMKLFFSLYAFASRLKNALKG